jgi:hypothetical protein
VMTLDEQNAWRNAGTWRAAHDRLRDRIQAALDIEPEDHATKSRDYGRGFAEAIRLVRIALEREGQRKTLAELAAGADERRAAKPGVPDDLDVLRARMSGPNSKSVRTAGKQT